MTDREFEQLIRTTFATNVDKVAPAALRSTVQAIPDVIAVRDHGGMRLFRFPPLSRAVVIGLASAVVVAAVALGVAILSRPSRDIGTESPTPLPTSSQTTATDPLGGGLILFYAASGTSQPCDQGFGWYNVLTLDPGSGTQTLLGGVCTSDRIALQWASDRLHILMTDEYRRQALPLEAPTSAGRQLSFICCNLPDVWRDTGFGSDDGWVLSPRGDKVAALGESTIQIPGKEGTTAAVDRVVVVDFDGSSEQTFASPPGSDVGGSRVHWSPDESAVAVSGCLPCNVAAQGQAPDPVQHAHLFLVPLDGSPVRQLLNTTDGSFGDPTWSPDGSRLLVRQVDCQDGQVMPFCNGRVSSRILAVLLPDGNTATLVVGNQVGGDFEEFGPPAISPDGSQIAFSTWSGDGADSKVYVTDAGGRNVVPVADGYFVQWSPDGQWLSVNRGSYPSVDLWIVRADGSHLRHIGEFAGAAW